MIPRGLDARRYCRLSHDEPATARSRVEAWLRDGGLVIFPTDTLYGLGARPEDERAVAVLFEAKGRNDHQPLPLIAASVDDVRRLGDGWSADTSRLAETYWPGPLSLVFDAPAWLAPAVHAGAGTVAVRVPNHPVARAVAAAAGGLVTATSANRSGQRAVQRVEDLDEIRDHAAILVVDGGETPGGRPSTIVDARGGHPVLLRDGTIPWDRVLTSLIR